MRILYGANSQGQGHLSKAAVLVPRLEARGHEVRVVTSGPPVPESYKFRWHRHLDGLAYAIRGGQTDFRKTAMEWLRNSPRILKSLSRLRGLVQEFQPDLILSDFEPLTASPLVGSRCEVICVSRQVALFDRAISMPDEASLERKLARTVIRLFTAGADRLFGYHYEPASYRCLPLVVRPELATVQPDEGEHLLVYCHSESSEELVEWANRRRQRVIAYGFPEVPRGRRGHVEFKPAGRESMLEDLRTARGVLTNAGLTTPIEAFLLGKPTVVIPIRRQWEQLVNARHLESAGLAASSESFDPELVLKTPPPPRDHPLKGWLGASPEVILDVLLGERRAA
ncbi:MAG: hypothetical protein KF777_10540 [Planctomycetaceae bacterium]|nr:hypothetical protein [Planctomycetaceae bacterium]